MTYTDICLGSCTGCLVSTTCCLSLKMLMQQQNPAPPMKKVGVILPMCAMPLCAMPHLHLLDLPVELLETILFYIPPLLLVTRVCATCRQLRDLLRSESFWKRHYAALMRAPVPLLESRQCIDWQQGCVQFQFARSLGRRVQSIRTTPLTGNNTCIYYYS